jgi:DNA end-binding protein Ku
LLAPKEVVHGAACCCPESAKGQGKNLFAPMPVAASTMAKWDQKLMKPRCTWSGYLKLSLVTIPVRVYTAVCTTDKIAFNQLHKSCHQRIRQKLVCPVHGEVTREDLVKGYEYATDKFFTFNETDLEALRVETTGTIELVQFVSPEELDPMFLDTPYYVGPDGPVAEEGFGVFVEALRRAKRIGIGRVVLSGKEKLVAVKPLNKGLVFFTLR